MSGVLLLLIVAIASGPTGAGAATNVRPGIGRRLSLLSHAGGRMNDVVVSNGRAYVAAACGLQVFDVSTGTAPVLLGELLLAGNPKRVTLAGPYVFVSCGDAGLDIVDVSAPASPVLVGSCPVPAEYACVVGTRAYVACGSAGLKIVDASDPAAPLVRGTCASASRVNAVVVSGGYAYLAGGAAGLQVVDVSDAAHPVIVSEYRPSTSSSYQAFDIALKDAYVYLAGGTSLSKIDVSEPVDPGPCVSVSRRNAAGNWMECSRTTLSGMYVYCDIGVYRIADLGGVGDCARVMSVSGDRGYAAGGTLDILDVSAPSSVTQVGSYTPPWTGTRLAGVSGDVLYVSEGTTGLWLYDASDPVTPVVKGLHSTGGYVYDVTISADRAYVLVGKDGMAGEMQIVDVADPAHPALLGTAPCGYSPCDVEVRDDHAFVVNEYGSHEGDGTQHASLEIYDVSDPSGPRLEGLCDTPDNSYGVSLSGDYACVADGPSVQVVDVSDHTAPRTIGSYTGVGWTYEVLALNGRAYVADYNSPGLLVLDLSNPAVPTLAGSYSCGEGIYRKQIAALDDHVLFGQNGLHVVDVSRPGSPELVGGYAAVTEGDVFVSGDRVYVHDWNGGLFTLSWDATPPAGAMSVAGGAPYARAVRVSIDSAITGATEMRSRNSGGAWSAWRAYSPTIVWDLAPGDGMKSVSAEYRDPAGNVLSCTDTIILDATPPRITTAVRTSYDVGATIRITATDGLSGIARTRWQLDRGPMMTTGTAVVTTSGSHVLKVTAVDRAGNAVARTWTFVIRRRVTLSAPSAARTWLSASRTYTFSGTLLPAHPSGRAGVRLRFYHLENGRWTLRKSVAASDLRMTTYSRYSARARLWLKGRWRVRATHSDTLHFGTSAYRYLTVY